MSTDRRPWPLRRRLALIALVFAGQIGLIFAVSDRKPLEPRRPDFVPELRLPSGSGESVAVADPTLFALPGTNGFSAGAWVGTNGFSAAAWLTPPADTPAAFEWTETNRWLPPPLGELGGVLTALMQTNHLRISYEIARPPEPVIVLHQPRPAPPPETRLSVEGDLAQRRMIGQLRLPLVPYADVLQDSVVQVFVDEAGDVMTATLLPPSSGSDEADQQALRLARSFRFAPLNNMENEQPHWTRGSMIFQWGTTTVSTNVAAGPR